MWDLSPHAAALYGELAKRGGLEVRYRDSSGAGDRSGPELEAFFLRAYNENLPVELERGATRRGPHRDDLEIEVDGVSARSYASRGEQRCAALAFRLAELRLLPGAVLLLDDVLSELDRERRGRVLAAVAGAQTIITTVERDAIPGEASVQASWRVEGGRLREEG